MGQPDCIPSMPTTNKDTLLDEVLKLHSKQDQLAGLLDHMEHQLNHVVHLLDGDRDPSNGVVVRLDRLEQSHSKASWMVKSATGAAIGAIVLTILSWVFHTPVKAEQPQPQPTTHQSK